MESIEKLREKIRLDINNPWSDLKGDLLAMCDKVEAEIAERYMPLPLDADGVPIHVGDALQVRDSDPFTVCAVAPMVVHWWADARIGDLKTTNNIKPSECRHYKPRTLEDVLEDFILAYDEWDEKASGTEHMVKQHEVFAKYAAEIRDMLGVEA